MFLLIPLSFTYYFSQNLNIVFNGIHLQIEKPLLIQNNYLCVPLEEITRKLKYSYIEANNNIIINDGYKTIKYTKNHDKVMVNFRKYFTPTKLFAYKDEWYVPLSYFSWYLGYTMKKSGKTYYTSKLLNNIKLVDNQIILYFGCRIEDDQFDIDINKQEHYLNLKNTILNRARFSGANSVYKFVSLGQITLRPGLVKLIIKTKEKIEATKHQNMLIIKPINESFSLPEKKSPEQIQIVPPKEELRMSSKIKVSKQAVWLPDFKGVKNIKLNVNGNKKTIKGLAKHEGDDYVVPLEEVLIPFGYNYRLDSEKNIFITYGDREEINIGLKGVIIGKVTYVPLQKLALKIGIGLRWDWRIHTLFVNPIIHKINYERKNNQELIHVYSYAEIEPKDIFYLSNPPRLVLDIPNAVLDTKTVNISLDGLNFKRMRTAQLDEKTVRVVVDLGKIKSYGLSLSEDGTKASIGVAGSVTKLGYKDNGSNYAKLIIHGKGLYNYKKRIIKNDIVLDFPDVNYKAKNYYSFGGYFLESIHGIQQSWDPLTAKMTISLRPKVKYRIEKKKNSIILHFTRSDKALTKYKDKPPPIKSKDILYGKTIVLEAGHGGIDVGTIGYGKKYEKWFTLDTSWRIRKYLMQYGARILMPITEDRFMSLSKRIVFANRNKADLYISVHYNSFTQRSINGISTYYYKNSDYKAAKHIHRALIFALKNTNRGLHRNRFFVLFHSKMPAVLIEPAFLSNPTEYNLLLTPAYRDKIAKAVAQGIINYYRYEN